METELTTLMLSKQLVWMEQVIKAEQRRLVWIHKLSKRIDAMLKIMRDEARQEDQ